MIKPQTIKSNYISLKLCGVQRNLRESASFGARCGKDLLKQGKGSLRETVATIYKLPNE